MDEWIVNTFDKLKRRGVLTPRRLQLLCALIFLFVAVIMFSLSAFVREQIEFVFSGPEPIIVPSEALVRPDWLAIPSLDIDAPVVYVSEKSESAFQSALAHGVAHYPGTALPGELGNVYLFGHSSDVFWSQGDYKTVFVVLPNIRIGDEIYLSNDRGEKFTYVVTDTFVVNPSDMSVLDQFEYQEKYLSIQTSYPVGTALKRFIVRAKLQEN